MTLRIAADPGAETPQSPRAIFDLLEDLLTEARAGRIKGLAVGAHYAGDVTTYRYALPDGSDRAHLVTAIERCKLHLLRDE